MNEEKAQELYERFVTLQQHTQDLEHHFQAMQEQLKGIEKTKQTITELGKLTEPTESWVPIAPGAYVKAIIKPADVVLLHVGAQAAVEKKPADVITTLDEHKKVLEELSDAALEELKTASDELEAIRKQVAEEQQE